MHVPLRNPAGRTPVSTLFVVLALSLHSSCQGAAQTVITAIVRPSGVLTAPVGVATTVIRRHGNGSRFEAPASADVSFQVWP